MTFHIINFGCKVNSYESEALKERLLSLGYKESESEDADLYFVNTCAVTQEAERKDVQKIRHIAREYPGRPIYVMGCSSQIHKDYYLSIGSVKALVGTSSRDRLENISCEDGRDFVDRNSRAFRYEDTPITSGEKNVRAYIKIQDGCDNFCSYCVVPITRGRSRSRYHGSILKEAKSLIDNGVKELVIGGIDAGSYLDPFTEGYDLTHLLSDMTHLSSAVYRIRLSSIEASQITPSFIELFKENQTVLCPHFHLPLQSGSEKILKRMNRKYDLVYFQNLVKTLKEEIPHCALSTDIICGFPGETEEDFLLTYQLAKEAPFMRIHAFPYSERPFTKASQFQDSIDKKVRMERVKRLMLLSSQNEKEYRKQLAGLKEHVLIEEKDKNGKYVGYSEHYLRYEINSERDITGEFITLSV